MSVLVKILLGVLLGYFLYSYVKDLFLPKQNRPKKSGGINILKPKNLEKPTFNIDAETVDYEEIKDNETHT